MATVKPMIERLMSKVEMIPIAGCWIFTGACDKHGYGTLSTGWKKSPIKAYRASYLIHIGEIPKGLVVRHKCDTPSCVNPNHLELGTQRDNVRDMVKRKGMNPNSLLNLCAGEKGVLGAGRFSRREKLKENK